jgi:hypothetical protein
MKKKNSIVLCIALFFIFFAGLITSGASDGGKSSGHGDNVDEIIQGFEDRKENEDLDNLLEGFDDNPTSGGNDAGLIEDELLQGFETESGENKEVTETDDKPSTWRLDGEFTSTATYNFNPDAESPWRGVTMLRQELELALKKQFSDNWQGQISGRGFYDLIYALRGKDEYTQQVLDEYESELELEDTYIQGSILENMDTKIGRQIVVWGTLDNLRVVDVLNPLDLRVPGLTDIDDLRLPVTMIKLDYYFGNWNLSGMAIPEVRFSKLPVYGSDFYPLPVPRPPEDVPDDGFQNAEYAAALTGVFSGWDVGFYLADFYDDQPYVETVPTGSTSQLTRKHARIAMLGTAANLALGNWLLKGEAAWLDGLKYSNTPGIEYSRLDLGGGLEYSGFSEATISIEAVNRYIFDYDQQLEMPPDQIRENEFQWNFRFVKDFLNDTLTLTLFASTFGIKADDGAFERIDAEYDITDAVSIRGGVVFYQSGDKGMFQSVAANDRLFLVFKYSF